MSADNVAAVAEELNYPGAATLKRVLRQRGIPFDPEEVDRMVAGGVVRQVQMPKYDFGGKIVSDGLHKRWFADLIDFTATPSDGGKRVGLGPTEDKERYILVVQDVFSRRLWTEALKDKRPSTVLQAFRTIMSRAKAKPERLQTDLGAEFGSVFQDELESEGIKVRKKAKEDINAIATLDVAIGRLKKALARVARRRRTDDWAELLQQVTKGQNEIPNDDYLGGRAPNDVAGSSELQRKLYDKNLEFAKHNAERAEKRANKLEENQQFRVMTSAGGRFTRGFKPSWSSTVHRVASVDGAFVTDEQGREYMTKFTQPVAANSEELPERRMERGGSATAETRKRRVLGALAGQVRAFIGSKRKTLAQVGAFIKPRGFRQLALEARINMRSPVANFLRTFPELFAVQTEGTGESYVSRAPSVPAFPGARRLRQTFLTEYK